MNLPYANIKPLSTRNDRPLYRLEEDFTSAEEHKAITVFKGFEYDGASTPRWTWSIFGMLPDGANREASLVHDWLYVRRGVLAEPIRNYNRKEVDQLFLQMLLDYGVSKWRSYVAYYAVRLAGNKKWLD